MTSATTGLLEAVEHLPPGGVLVVPGVAWDEYELLLESMEAHPGHRVTYNCGRMQIVSPYRRHEYFKEVIGCLVRDAAAHWGLGFEPSGGTTIHSRRKQRGVEPDSCYHLQHADDVIGKESFDPDVDPMPDLVVEIDLTNSSLEKFPVYADLGVPEIWRYYRDRVEFYQLRDGNYAPNDASIAFPFLRPGVVEEALKAARSRGVNAAVAHFGRWLRKVSP